MCCVHESALLDLLLLGLGRSKGSEGGETSSNLSWGVSDS